MTPPTKLDRRIEEEADRTFANLKGCSPNYSYDRSLFIEGAHFVQSELMPVILKMMEALEFTLRHYEHPEHDHNWAYYIKEIHKQALNDLNKSLGE